MFGKKKKINKDNIPAKFQAYNDWENDFGYLTLIMTRRINLAKKYDITLFAKMLENKADFVKQNDVEPIYINTTNQIYSMLSQNYKNFLIEKYFGEDKNLLYFIEELVLDEFISAGIGLNEEKIKRQAAEDTQRVVNILNGEEGS